ncbi:MAG: hypothetical protein JXB50_06760 [Spirochaetes bacterium]|nr:hypothetical protein [Spirochaetota bacterium]
MKDIIKNGWKSGVLSIKEYNIIVQFSDLYNKMSAVNKKPVLIYNDFIKFEDSFYKVISNDIYLKNLLEGLNKIFTYYKESFFNNNEKIIKQLINLLESFFSFNFIMPSIYDIILAFNIINARRFLNWDELYEKTKEDFIQSNFFDCSVEVFEQIVKSIKSSLSEIEIIEKDIARIEWLKNYSSLSNNTNPDKIICFYIEILKKDWHKDSDDLFLLLLSLFNGIIEKMNELLSKDFVLMNEKEELIKKRIFSNMELEELFNNLKEQYTSAKDRHLSVTPSKIPLEFYISQINPEFIFTDINQKFIFEKIYNVFYFLRQMAFKLYYIINDEKELNKMNFIKFMIVKPEEWKGKILISLINFYIELFLQICGYFKEKNLILELNKLNKLILDRDKSLKKIEMISDSNKIIERFLKNDKIILL